MPTKQDTVETESLRSEIGLDRLAREAQQFSKAAADRGVSRIVDRVDALTDRLTDVGSGGVARTAKNVARGDSGPTAALKAGVESVKEGGGSTLKASAGALKERASSVKDKLGGALGRGSKDKDKDKKLKLTNIVEELDVPVPRSVAYELWTQFEDFPGLMKKVENVDQKSDETVEWKAQIFWSHRSWTATIVDQVPNERIVWRSKGDKGHVDGAVTFHELAPDLTRILVVLEYHAQGLLEHAGNLWRLQGRRVRLELKHFRRHVTTQTLLHQDEVDGWTGEIHEGKVVRKRASSKSGGSKRGSSSSSRARKSTKSASSSRGSSSPSRVRKSTKSASSSRGSSSPSRARKSKKKSASSARGSSSPSRVRKSTKSATSSSSRSKS